MTALRLTGTAAEDLRAGDLLEIDPSTGRTRRAIVGPGVPMSFKLWIAGLDTPNFKFEAYGRSYEQAVDVLRRAWNRHRRQTGASWTFSEALEGGDVFAREIEVGKAYRDGSPI